jgi:hypothetical protein
MQIDADLARSVQTSRAPTGLASDRPVRQLIENTGVNWLVAKTDCLNVHCSWRPFRDTSTGEQE